MVIESIVGDSSSCAILGWGVVVCVQNFTGVYDVHGGLDDALHISKFIETRAYESRRCGSGLTKLWMPRLAMDNHLVKSIQIHRLDTKSWKLCPPD